jgi:hypothetical protein
MTLLKTLEKQSGPFSSPLRSWELSSLQPWLETGTEPLVSNLTKPSTPELQKGLPVEVEILAEIMSGLIWLFVAKDFSFQNLVAENKLQNDMAP